MANTIDLMVFVVRWWANCHLATEYWLNDRPTDVCHFSEATKLQCAYMTTAAIRGGARSICKLRACHTTSPTTFIVIYHFVTGCSSWWSWRWPVVLLSASATWCPGLSSLLTAPLCRRVLSDVDLKINVDKAGWTQWGFCQWRWWWH